jgi:lysophospholipase L1-like esterase
VRLLAKPLPIGRPELLLLAASLAFVPALILAAEGGLTLLHRGAVTDANSSGIDELHRYSPVYGWEPRPGRYVQGGHVVTINDRGYRGPAAGPRDPSRRRVVVLGDSVAFGLEVDDRQTYAAALGERDGRLEVVNLAVQGYGPGQSLLRLERLGLSLEPDVVVLGFCLANDFADAMLSTFLYDQRHPQPFFTLDGDELVRHDEHLRLDLRERTALWLRDHSRLYRRFLSEPAPPPSGARGSWMGRRRAALRDREASLDLVTRLVAAMRDLALSHGAAFLVLLHPYRPTPHAEDWASDFEARLEAEGIAVIDLLRSYEERGLDFDDITIDAIGHLSPPGHAQTAMIVDRALATADLPLRRVSLMGTSPPRPR